MKHAVVLSLFALSCATAPRVDHPALELTVPEQWTTGGPAGAVGDRWWRDHEGHCWKRNIVHYCWW